MDSDAEEVSHAVPRTEDANYHATPMPCNEYQDCLDEPVDEVREEIDVETDDEVGLNSQQTISDVSINLSQATLGNQSNDS